MPKNLQNKDVQYGSLQQLAIVTQSVDNYSDMLKTEIFHHKNPKSYTILRLVNTDINKITIQIFFKKSVINRGPRLTFGLNKQAIKPLKSLSFKVIWKQSCQCKHNFIESLIQCIIACRQLYVNLQLPKALYLIVLSPLCASFWYNFMSICHYQRRP